MNIRPIDAVELRRILMNEYIFAEQSGLAERSTAFALTMTYIDNAPTIEGDRKGKWIKTSVHIWRCPYCGWLESQKSKFCCECGADMRGKRYAK